MLQAGATFGWTGKFGNIDNPVANSLDDLVLSSLRLDFTDPATSEFFEDLGAGFAYRNTFLDPFDDVNPLLPEKPYNSDMLMGKLDVVIGDLRGTTASPLPALVCFGAAQNDGDYPTCSPGLPRNLGSVELFDLSVSPAARLSLLPPPDLPPCGSQASLFGNGLAIGDVDGDGFADLVVGAPGSNSSLGRV